MDARFRRGNLAIIIVLLVAGCRTPFALHRNTVQLGDTVADIHQQQVLDNLAKFVCDPYAIPSFALANSGTSDITDSCNGGLSVSWIATGFDSLGLNFMGTRQKQNNWTVTPITDPRKLELMRCAYQRSVSQCTGVGEATCCPDCQRRFNEFYTGYPVPPPSAETTSSTPTTATDVLPPPTEAGGGSAQPTPVICNACPTDSTQVTADCLNTGRCWFHRGCKNSVPKCCGYVGHYCDTYVWVCPGPDRDELAKLTLAILDYATHDGATLPTKQVTAYIAADGSPTTLANANFVIQATIESDERSLSVIKADVVEGKKLGLKSASAKNLTADSLNLAPVMNAPTSIPSLRALPPQRTPMPNTNLLYLQQQLNTVR